MAKNLLIRDLPEDVNKALEKYKDEHYLGNNTDAARRMLSAFYHQKDQIEYYKDRAQTFERKCNHLQSLIAKYLGAVSALENAIEE